MCLMALECELSCSSKTNILEAINLMSMEMS